MNKRVSLALLVSFCTLLSVMGQTRPAAPPIDDKDDVVRITTNLVQVDAVVLKDGKPVPDLTAGDFEIYEDGKQQKITTFAYISNTSPSSTPPAAAREDKKSVAVPAAPIRRNVPRRTIAIIIDDLGLSAESMSQARRQARKFIAEQIQPNDLVAIVRTGGEMGALQQFTNDKRLLNRAVDLARWNPCNRVGITVFQPYRTGAGRGEELEPCGGRSYGKTLRAMRFILDAMGQLPGRKAMIVMSDSMPNENQELFGVQSASAGLNPINYSAMLHKVAEKAIRSSVVIYSVDTQGLQPTGPTAADSFRGNVREITAQMNELLSTRAHLLQDRRAGGDFIARQTGGFQVRNSNDFKLDRILEEQSGYYLLGYRPTDETFNKRFHHIKAKVKRSGMTLRTRFGFFGMSEEEVNRPRLSTVDATNLALMSPFGAQDIQLDLTSFFANNETQGSLIRSFVYFDAGNLTFVPVNDRYETSLEIHGVVFGDNGAVIDQGRQRANLSLREDEYQQAMRKGVNLRFDMPAKRPGSYQVRVAVRDVASSRIGSVGQFVAVPDLKKGKLALSGIVLQGTADTSTQTAAMTTPAIRRFALNSDLHFAMMIYNAALDPSTQLPNLTIETKLFRDGKVVSSAPEKIVDVANQPDLSRLFTTGVVRLGAELEPGNYYLQVAITDNLWKMKRPPVVQWIDFEILK